MSSCLVDKRKERSVTLYTPFLLMGVDSDSSSSDVEKCKVMYVTDQSQDQIKNIK